MPSTRRVKKGPGRRPLSAKRQRFMERPAGIRVIPGPAVGTSGQSQVPVPGRADRDRRPRARWGEHPRHRPAGLGRAPSTISRELRRNAGSGRRVPAVRSAPAGDGPSPGAASPAAPRHPRGTAAAGERAPGATVEPRNRSAVSCDVAFLTTQRCGCVTNASIRRSTSPDQCCCVPRAWAPQRRSPLRTGRDHRRAQQKADRRRPRFEQPMLSIHDASSPLTGQRLGTGKETSSSVRITARPSRLWSSARPGT